MKRLLVTSDDFGMCHAINVGTLLAMTTGIVRSTNLMAPCPWFEEAARLCRVHALPAGVHLTLTCEWDQLRWRALTRAPGLADESGCLPNSHDEVAAATDAEIEAEFRAQIALVRSRAVTPSHLDLHMLPPAAGGPHAERVQRIAAELAREAGIPFTYETRAGRLLHFRDMLEISTFSEAEIALRLGSWTEPGDYHLSGHAGVASAELASLASAGAAVTPWAERYRTRDLTFFTSPLTHSTLLAAGFTLVGIRDLFG